MEVSSWSSWLLCAEFKLFHAAAANACEGCRLCADPDYQRWSLEAGWRHLGQTSAGNRRRGFHTDRRSHRKTAALAGRPHPLRRPHPGALHIFMGYGTWLHKLDMLFKGLPDSVSTTKYGKHVHNCLISSIEGQETACCPGCCSIRIPEGMKPENGSYYLARVGWRFCIRRAPLSMKITISGGSFRPGLMVMQPDLQTQGWLTGGGVSATTYVDVSSSSIPHS